TRFGLARPEFAGRGHTARSMLETSRSRHAQIRIVAGFFGTGSDAAEGSSEVERATRSARLARASPLEVLVTLERARAEVDAASADHRLLHRRALPRGIVAVLQAHRARARARREAPGVEF